LRRFLSLPTHPRTRVRRRPPTRRLLLEQLEPRLAPAVSLVNHFDALNASSNGGSPPPPDACGAAGPSSYIETVNSAVTIYNKSTNAVIASDTISDFLFTQGGITSKGGLYDATMIYDEFTGQFIIGDSDLAWPSGKGSAAALDIAVSKTSNPTTLDSSSWHFYQINVGEANEHADYEGNLGYNADAFVFTYNMLDTLDTGFHVQITAVSQSSLAAGGALSAARIDVNKALSWRPVTMHDSTSGGPMWFVEEHLDNKSIDLERIDNILTATASLHPFNIAVNPYNAVNAPLNPDGSAIESTLSLDSRILKAAERNNDIVACQQVGVGTNEDDARWYEFDVSNISSPSLVQQGNVGFGANTYTVYPAIDINANGDIAMGFTKSGNDTTTDYMSTFITGRKSSDSAGAMETPVEIKAGDSNNTDGREGDFSGINVDPNDGTFWVADEYTTNNSWATEVANFAMNTQTFFVVNGQLQIYGDQLGANYNDSIVVDVNGRGGVSALLNGEPVGFDPGQITSIGVAPGGGNNTVDINATRVPVFIVGSGNDTYVLAPSSDFLDNIQGPVTINGGTGTNTLTVDDQSDPFDGDTYTIGVGSVGRNAEAQISYSGVSSVTVNGSSTANITYDIDSTASGTPLTINAGNGANSFVMTPDSDFLDNIQGAVTLNAGTGSNTLTVDDQSDPFDFDTYTIGAGSVQRNNEALISYSGVSSVTVNGSNTAAITYDINGTASGTPLTINAGSGANVLDLTPTSENLNDLAGAVTINAGSASTVNVDDQLNAAAATYTVTATTVSRSGFGGLTYAGLGALVLNGGSHADTYNILGTAAGSSVTAQGGAANDTFNLGSGHSLNGLLGAVTVNGGGGSNTLVVNDSSSAAGQSYTLSATQLTRSGIAPITYASLSAIHATGSSNDTLTLLSPVPTVATTFNGTGGTTTLQGANATNSWTISGNDSGKLDSVTFSNFKNLKGGTGNDTFNFTTNAAGVPGTLDGGGGTDKLSFAKLGSGSGVTVTLTSNTAGSTDRITGGFSNIESVAGNTNINNTLVGPNSTNAWTISGSNAGKVNSFAFSGMAHLVGGTGVDTFTFSNTSGTVLSIKGGGAPAQQGDWLNYAAFGSSSTVTVYLPTGAATNVSGGGAGGVTGIQNVIGSASGTNNLTGDSQGNILIGGSGLNTLTAGSGNSLLIGGSGHGTLTGGPGSDILIAGTTTYKATTTAGQFSLMAVLAELQSSDTFTQIVSDLTNGNSSGGGSDLNGSNKLTWGGSSATVKPSTGVFTLAGDTAASANADWFFSNSSSTVSDFNDDAVNDAHNNKAIGTF
jgi:hypothetical protein